jgi:hypothetical protein
VAQRTPAVTYGTAIGVARAYDGGMQPRTESDLALGLMRNAEALVSVMDGLSDEAEAYGRLLIDEPTVKRLSSLLRERGQLRAILRATRTSESY